RRRLITASAASVAALMTPAIAAPLSKFGIDAATLGVRPGAPDDQTRALQRAIDQAAKARVPLMLAPGVYRAGDLKLPACAHLAGVRGATRLMLTGGPSLIGAHNADTVSLEGLVLDGGGQTLPDGRGLVHLTSARGMRIAECEIARSGGHGIALEQCDGEVTHTTIANADDTALFSRDGRSLIIAANVIRDSGDGGIRVWQSDKRDDGSSIVDNRIENT